MFSKQNSARSAAINFKIEGDTTIREIDYVDSGHIRLGELTSLQIAWNPKDLEILDFEADTVRDLLFHETIYYPRIDE